MQTLDLLGVVITCSFGTIVGLLTSWLLLLANATHLDLGTRLIILLRCISWRNIIIISHQFPRLLDQSSMASALLHLKAVVVHLDNRLLRIIFIIVILLLLLLLAHNLLLLSLLLLLLLRLLLLGLLRGLRLLTLILFALFSFHFLLTHTFLLILIAFFLSSGFFLFFGFFRLLLLAHQLLLGGLLLIFILLLLALIALSALLTGNAKNLHHVRRGVNTGSCGPKHLLQEEVCLFRLVTSDDLRWLTVDLLADD